MLSLRTRERVRGLFFLSSYYNLRWVVFVVSVRGQLRILTSTVGPGQLWILTSTDGPCHA